MTVVASLCSDRVGFSPPSPAGSLRALAVFGPKEGAFRSKRQMWYSIYHVFFCLFLFLCVCLT